MDPSQLLVPIVTSVISSGFAVVVSTVVNGKVTEVKLQVLYDMIEKLEKRQFASESSHQSVAIVMTKLEGKIENIDKQFGSMERKVDQIHERIFDTTKTQ